jgi:ABC-type branched-subunit amino acid transport system permease subunit
MIGALLIYYVLFNILPNLPQQAKGIAEALGLNVVVTPTPGYPGLVEEVQRLKFLLFGIILVTVMVLRPQGLLPSRIRRAELKHEGTEPVLDVGTA